MVQPSDASSSRLSAASSRPSQVSIGGEDLPPSSSWYTNVSHGKQSGSLLLNEEAVHFYTDNGLQSVSLKWSNIQRIKANAVGSSARSLLKVTINKEDGNNNNDSFTFQFETRDELDKARNDMKTRWKVSQGGQVARENNTMSSDIQHEELEVFEDEDETVSLLPESTPNNNRRHMPRRSKARSERNLLDVNRERSHTKERRRASDSMAQYRDVPQTLLVAPPMANPHHHDNRYLWESRKPDPSVSSSQSTRRNSNPTPAKGRSTSFSVTDSSSKSTTHVSSRSKKLSPTVIIKKASTESTGSSSSTSSLPDTPQSAAGKSSSAHQIVVTYPNQQIHRVPSTNVYTVQGDAIPLPAGAYEIHEERKILVGRKGSGSRKPQKGPSNANDKVRMVSRDQIMVQTGSKRQLLMDFSDMDRTHSVRVLSLDQFGYPTGVSRTVSLDDDQDLEVGQCNNDEGSVDYDHFYFAGYLISKRVCFGSVMFACMGLICLIVAIVLVVVYADFGGDTSTRVDLGSLVSDDTIYSGAP
ncbi:expressed unknown protein [Seminavis robusta]|uniref:TFIIH p62 subunit N-terminal domain-containing protein n=1 Tax=Seminavis robusta TaxID=568900 RepID=A0A9N8HY49_9STRA|nr:expressed unknown protein [Seminavis robusta]|eukprot:Sro2386_g325750.1 n/a (527) ;mRNA; f:6864-8444